MASSDDDSNHHPWKRNAWESRQAISESLVALPKHYPPRKSVNVSEYHEMAQTYLFEYFSVFQPKRDEFGADEDPDESETMPLWWEPLITVEIPMSDRVRLNGSANVLQGNGDLLTEIADEIPTQARALCLGNIQPIYQADSTFQIEATGWLPNHGPVTETVTETRYMPVAAIREVRSQLDRCLEEAGWLPEIASTPRTEITDDLIEEVEEWRQENVE